MAFTTLENAKFAAGIINEGMERLGYSKESQINVGDDATIETITEGMKRVGSLPADLVNPLLNQIDIVLIYRNYATMFTESKNPTRTFWRDAINYGGGEEDIYQEILTPVEGVLGTWAEDYADGDEDNSKALSSAAYHFGYHPGKVTKKFHTAKKHFDIAISLSEHEISKIFTPEGFAGYVSVRLANIQYSAEYKLMGVVIENIVRMANNQAMMYRENFNLNDMLGVTDFVEDIKMVTDGMKMPSTLFNQAGILTFSNDEDLFLVTTPEVLARVGTRGAENAYNLEQYMFHNRVIKLPAGTELGTSPNGQQILGIVLDKRSIVMALRYWSMRPFIPSGSDFQNYFLKVEYVHGYNEFFNCVALCGEGLDTFEKKNLRLEVVVPNSMLEDVSDLAIGYQQHDTTIDDIEFEKVGNTFIAEDFSPGELRITLGGNSDSLENPYSTAILIHDGVRAPLYIFNGGGDPFNLGIPVTLVSGNYRIEISY